MKKLGALTLVAALVACSGPDDIEPGPAFVSSVAVDGFATRPPTTSTQ